MNVQGRKMLRDGSATDVLKKHKQAGRDFARFAHDFGLDPRAFVLTKLFEFLKSVGTREVRAIRPAEHLMAIGNHPGFKGNYDPVLARAGMIIESELYRLKDLSKERLRTIQ